jgi:hypothetical protein
MLAAFDRGQRARIEASGAAETRSLEPDLTPTHLRTSKQTQDMTFGPRQ